MLSPPVVADTGSGVAANASLPDVPHLTIEIPHAMAVYSADGLHIKYVAFITDETNDLLWRSGNRYSAYRKLHSEVGKYYVASSEFPSLLLTSKFNRNKSSIDSRMTKLQTYMQKLLAAVFDAPQRSVPFHHVASILKFLEYPFSGDWDMLVQLAVDVETRSTPSETLTEAQEAISALSTPEQFSSTTQSSWRAPGVLPGPRIGLQLPFASIQQDIEGHWEMVVKGERGAKKGVLRHRYDEAAAVAFKLAKGGVLMDSGEAQDFIMEFRRKHPIAAYMRFEKALEANSPSASSRMDRSSSTGMSDTHTESHGSPTDSSVDEFPKNVSAAEKMIYESKRQISDSSFVETVTHFCLADSHAAAPSSLIYQDVYVTPSKPQATPSRFHDPEDDGVADDVRLTVPSPSAHGTPQQARRPPAQPVESGISGKDKYLSIVRGNKVAGCRCSPTAFCSTGCGDLYETVSGFALIVVPPPP